MAERRADGHIRTTEWEDVQYKFGNAVGKYYDQEAEIVAQRTREAHPENPCEVYDPLRDKAERLDNDVEDQDLDDDDALAAYRRKRMAEVQSSLATPSFGTVRAITSETYVSEVTEASAKSWVVLLLTEQQHAKCDQLLSVFHTVAQQRKDIKFVTIKATDAVKNFPTQELPCVLLYHDRALYKQLTGLELWGGRNVSTQTVLMQLKLQGIVSLVGEDGDNNCDDDDDSEQSGSTFIKKF
eukprot:PhF_6_TR3428/c0_g1_i3/m.4991